MQRSLPLRGSAVQSAAAYCKQVPIVVARYIRVSLKYSTSFMVTRYNLNGMARSKGNTRCLSLSRSRMRR